jgi:hypothetical protein
LRDPELDARARVLHRRRRVGIFAFRNVFDVDFRLLFRELRGEHDVVELRKQVLFALAHRG